MPSNVELRREQKMRLFQIKKVKADNPGVLIKGLDELIILIEAEMEAEDVAWVEKKLAQLKDSQ